MSHSNEGTTLVLSDESIVLAQRFDGWKIIKFIGGDCLVASINEIVAQRKSIATTGIDRLQSINGSDAFIFGSTARNELEIKIRRSVMQSLWLKTINIGRDSPQRGDVVDIQYTPNDARVNSKQTLIRANVIHLIDNFVF